MRKSKAKRKLVTENEILNVLWRVENGVTLNTAVKIQFPDINPVSSIKLIKWYQELTEALDNDNIDLASTIRDSLFPSWIVDGEPQPYNATYIGRFPYGYWEL